MEHTSAEGFTDTARVNNHAQQSPISNPGRHVGALGALSTDPAELSAVARNLIVHYRASGHELPDTTRDDINLRWLEAILDADRQRHDAPLDRPREPTERVQGCCRDHTLFCVGALRASEAWDAWGRIGLPDDGLRPGPTIIQASPYGDPSSEVDLSAGGGRR